VCVPHTALPPKRAALLLEACWSSCLLRWSLPIWTRRQNFIDVNWNSGLHAGFFSLLLAALKPPNLNKKAKFYRCLLKVGASSWIFFPIACCIEASQSEQKGTILRMLIEIRGFMLDFFPIACCVEASWCGSSTQWWCMPNVFCCWAYLLSKMCD